VLVLVGLGMFMVALFGCLVVVGPLIHRLGPVAKGEAALVALAKRRGWEVEASVIGLASRQDGHRPYRPVSPADVRVWGLS
jgi:hypothetical protein